MAKTKFKGYNSRFAPSADEAAQELHRIRIMAQQAKYDALRIELDSVKAALQIVTNYIHGAGRVVNS